MPSRSIPACAGEPAQFGGGCCTGEVYPRVCGGTRENLGAGAVFAGLSPRVRGNHPMTAGAVNRAGSIPACAGEPRPPAPIRSTPTVYPRVCGGTAGNPYPGRPARGLSPRVRGNLQRAELRQQIRRSIPACAGEPSETAMVDIGRKVYPRVCGGTPVSDCGVPKSEGLSPRVRGNLVTSSFSP